MPKSNVVEPKIFANFFAGRRVMLPPAPGANYSDKNAEMIPYIRLGQATALPSSQPITSFPKPARYYSPLAANVSQSNMSSSCVSSG